MSDKGGKKRRFLKAMGVIAIGVLVWYFWPVSFDIPMDGPVATLVFHVATRRDSLL